MGITKGLDRRVTLRAILKTFPAKYQRTKFLLSINDRQKKTCSLFVCCLCSAQKSTKRERPVKESLEGADFFRKNERPIPWEKERL